MVNKAMFDEIRVLKQKIRRLEAVKQAQIYSPICLVMLEEYNKQFELLWEMISPSMESIDFFVSKSIELYYYHGLTVEEISEYFFRGLKSPGNVRKTILDFFNDMKRIE